MNGQEKEPIFNIPFRSEHVLSLSHSTSALSGGENTTSQHQEYMKIAPTWGRFCLGISTALFPSTADCVHHERLDNIYLWYSSQFGVQDTLVLELYLNLIETKNKKWFSAFVLKSSSHYFRSTETDHNHPVMSKLQLPPTSSNLIPALEFCSCLLNLPA